MRRWFLDAMGVVVLFSILALLGFGLQAVTNYVLPPGWDQYKYLVPPDWLERTTLSTVIFSVCRTSVEPHRSSWNSLPNFTATCPA